MDMNWTRQYVVIVGLILPHAAAASRGNPFALIEFLFLRGFSPFYWGSILALSYKCRHPIALLPAVLLGYGYIFWCFGVRDWGADAQSALGYIWFPMYSLVPIAIGAAVGHVIDRWIGLRPPFTRS